MAAPQETMAEVDVLGPAELEQAKDATLERLDMTLAELEGEARTGEFRSERARSAWSAFVAFGLVEPNGERV